MSRDFEYGFNAGREAYKRGAPKIFPRLDGLDPMRTEMFQGWHAGYDAAQRGESS